MRIVIALGGNALLRRSDPMTTEVQRRNITIAAEAIAPLAAEHSIVVVHGNGPQVGLLSLQAEAYREAEPYPLDVLDAGTQGMIGYLIQQELRSLLPPETQVATLLTMIVVDPDDPAFASPAKFVGPVYQKNAADVPEELAGYKFAAGSMGPKVEAATRFAAKTGMRAAIGSLADIAGIVAGKAGTNVVRQGAPGGAASSSDAARHTKDDADGNTSATPGRKMSSSRTRPAAAARVSRNRPEELR